MSDQFDRPNRPSVINRILGCNVRREGSVFVGRPKFVSVKRLQQLMNLPWVEDVRIYPVADVDESWDGEPYDTVFEVRVLMQEIEV